MRILVATKANWKMHFTHSLSGALSIRELMTTPRLRHRVFHATGDATPTTFAFVLWSSDTKTSKHQVIVHYCANTKNHYEH